MSDFTATFYFFITMELLGFAAWPLANRLFSRFPDHGWAFSKVIGVLLTVWVTWLLSFEHVLSFSRAHSIAVAGGIATVLWLGSAIKGTSATTNLLRLLKHGFFSRERNWYMVWGELFFILALFMWTDLRSIKSDIEGLEKFMDYGFMLSALKTEYFPPLDHFLAGEGINYYYLGHLIGALLTQLSNVPSGMGYNLQMSNILALGLQESFVLGALFFLHLKGEPRETIGRRSLVAGTLSAAFVMLLGNLHYLVYYPFRGDKYWFPDSTRYIPFTIHEYPLYSFVVNDLHGHVSDIPIVLMCIGLAWLLYQHVSTPRAAAAIPAAAPDVASSAPTVVSAAPSANAQTAVASTADAPAILPVRLPRAPIAEWFSSVRSAEFAFVFIFTAFVIGGCYVVSSWDFMIYLLLSGAVFWTGFAKSLEPVTGRPFEKNFFEVEALIPTGVLSAAIVAVAVLFWLPHWLDMKPPAQGVALVGWGSHTFPPYFLVVWGLQWYFVGSYLYFRWLENKHTKDALKAREKKKKGKNPAANQMPAHELFSFPEVMLVIAAVLTILPEVIYFKDIYPGHPRSNTMFKFYYQVWIMLGLVSGVGAVVVWKNLWRFKPSWTIGYKTIAVILIGGAVGYTSKATDQFIAGEAKNRGLDGTKFLERSLPADAGAIRWLNENVKGQPFIVEAVGDSYTFYARVASFTGFPTVLGWPNHEWLWRGNVDKPMNPISKLQKRTGQPDTVDQRRLDVERLYVTDKADEAKALIDKYQIQYVYVGKLERDKYPKLIEEKFATIAKAVVYDKDGVKIYRVRD